MAISETILEELKRYNKINNYILEQEADPFAAPADTDPLAGGDVPPAPDAGATPPAPEAGVTPPAPETQPVDVANDPDVEKVGDEGSEETGNTGLTSSSKPYATI